jgi:hypothetical protein
LLDIREIDAPELLKSSRPGDHVLAILGRGGDALIKEIVKRIAGLRGHERGRVLAQLVILPGLRGLPERRRAGFRLQPGGNQRRRPARYNDLVKRVRAAMRVRIEITNGDAFKLDSKAVTLPEAAEWISMERTCCPILTLQLSASGNQADWV